MANRVVYTIVGADKFSAVANKIRISSFKMRSKILQAGVAMETFGNKAKRAGEKLRNVGAKMSVVSAGIVALGLGAIREAAKIETLGVTFEVMTGSAEKGRKVLADLRRFTADTPFQLEQVTGAAVKLLSAGVGQEDVTDRLGRLGDLSAATGKPLGEMASIFAKVRVNGKLTGETLQQFLDAGIDLKGALSTKFGVSMDVLTKAISKGQVSFDAVKGALVDMTSEGGKFFNLTQKQSKTLAGRWSTFGDAVKDAGAELGLVLSDQINLKGFLTAVTDKIKVFTEGFRKFTQEHPAITRLGLAFVAFIAVMGPLLVIGGTVVTMFGFLAAGAGALGIATATMAAPLIAIPLALGAIVAAGVLVMQNWADMKLAAQFLMEDISALFGRIASAATSFLPERLQNILGFGDTDVTSSSQTNIQMDINAPKGVVAGIKTETSGQVAGLNVGVNMAEAR